MKTFLFVAFVVGVVGLWSWHAAQPSPLNDGVRCQKVAVWLGSRDVKQLCFKFDDNNQKGQVVRF